MQINNASDKAKFSQNEKIFKLSSSVLVELLFLGKGESWGGVRETSYALWALKELRITSVDTFIDPFIEDGEKWLKEKATKKKNKYSHYEDEVWDTSLALLAIGGKESELRNRLAGWLVSKQYYGAFDGEVWEPCFAILALASLDNDNFTQAINSGINWLESISGLANNEPTLFITPTYTAFVAYVLITIGGKNLNTKSIAKLITSTCSPENQQWAQAIILLFLSCAQGTNRDNINEIMGSVKKYIENNKEKRVEDLALSLIALHHLLGTEKSGDKILESCGTMVRKESRRVIRKRVDGSIEIIITKKLQKIALAIIGSLGFILATYKNWSLLESLYESLTK